VFKNIITASVNLDILDFVFLSGLYIGRLQVSYY